jgi:hypothetical protein
VKRVALPLSLGWKIPPYLEDEVAGRTLPEATPVTFCIVA